MMVRGMIKCFPRSTRVPKLLPAGRRHRQATLANAHRNGLVASSLTDGEVSRPDVLEFPFPLVRAPSHLTMLRVGHFGNISVS